MSQLLGRQYQIQGRNRPFWLVFQLFGPRKLINNILSVLQLSFKLIMRNLWIDKKINVVTVRLKHKIVVFQRPGISKVRWWLTTIRLIFAV